MTLPGAASSSQSSNLDRYQSVPHTTLPPENSHRDPSSQALPAPHPQRPSDLAPGAPPVAPESLDRPHLDNVTPRLYRERNPESIRNGGTYYSVIAEQRYGKGAGKQSATLPVLQAKSDSNSSQRKRQQQGTGDGPAQAPDSRGLGPAADVGDGRLSRSRWKKPRLASPRSIDLSSLVSPKLYTTIEDPTSPIFFSSTSSRANMTRPHQKYATAEATANMIDRMRQPDSVTTHQLARGSIDSNSPARSVSTHASWPFEGTGSSKSPGSVPAHLQSLQSVGTVEFLEQDERPTFVVDLTSLASSSPEQLPIMFSNASLRASPKLLDLLAPDTSEAVISKEFARFKAWVVSYIKDKQSTDILLPSTTYGNVTWTCWTLRKRYRVVSGAWLATVDANDSMQPHRPSPITVIETSRASTPDLDPATPREPIGDSDDYFGSAEDAMQHYDLVMAESPADFHSEADPARLGLHMADTMGEPGRTSFDWTRISVHPGLDAHFIFARSIDWARTPLGPMEHWPSDLRVMSNLIMGSPNPAAMYWGEEYTAIYNEAYTQLAGQKHPMMMGTSYTVVWAEIWDGLKPTFENAWIRGQATMKYDDQLFIIRNGFLEETYFNWSIIPLVGGDGNVVALYNPAWENTRRKVNERRMQTLGVINEKTAPARDIKSFWQLALKGLEFNEFDIPFVLMYSTCPDESESEVSSLHSGSLANPPTVVLEGSLGVPAGHPTAVKYLDLRTSDEGFAPYMREAMSCTDSPIVLSKESGTLPHHLISGFEGRGFGDAARTIVVFPVHPTPTGEAVAGFIVMGTNPRRPYNEDFELFIKLLSRALATSMASVALFEEEIRKGQKAARIAALDRQELSLQLRLRTQEAVESEYKFSRMAEFAPVGMFITNNQAKITYSNDMWWQISRHPRSHDTLGSWMQSVRDEDRPGLEEVWTKLVTEKVTTTHEFRFKSSSQAEGHPVDTWVLLSAFPEKDANGDLKRIFGCITDITQQKWAETFQRQRREEAVELKRQQENFIDMTSHEMRNPLSAILQCSDEITSGLARFRSGNETLDMDLQLLMDGCLEAANTIALCASHQKRIVDDILTFSKLDSQLLLVTPVDAQPIAAVQKVLKMFESEIRSNQIRVEFRVEKSYEELGVDWVKIDPSRLQQILINLMTNAIKFTNARDSPTIIVSMGASRNNGDGTAPLSGLSYFPTRSPATENITDKPEWGSGEKVYLHFSVTDTGPGLDAKEKKLLFHRFSQTSPRTHVQYGGSGLGLYISRILSELQGGQISVVSEKGVGSTFAFYIQARKVEPGNISANTLAAAGSFRIDTAASKSNGSGSGSSNSIAKPSSLSAPEGASYALGKTTISPTTTSPASNLNGASPQRQRDVVNASAATTRSPTPNSSHNHRPLDVLIVEDNLVNQRVLQRQLVRCGNNTLVANHGQEALATLRRSRFWRHGVIEEEQHQLGGTGEQSTKPGASMTDDPSTPGTSMTSTGQQETDINISVILMDLEMPVMDGMTCARRIRELEQLGVIAHHIPIIAVTAYARPEQIETAKAAGIDDVISKPFRIPELIPKIEELVSKFDTYATLGSSTMDISAEPMVTSPPTATAPPPPPAATTAVA
ncbi:hypothetical protein M0657_002227 [Pyricularia oryzae]|nr:hypothetical protein OOU_Y34scaffold00594g16 [Pyricularia oryzae Y34]KAI7929549.1 hypothetical protein M0657_002227 [Pyricularia oryzae]